MLGFAHPTDLRRTHAGFARLSLETRVLLGKKANLGVKQEPWFLQAPIASAP